MEESLQARRSNRRRFQFSITSLMFITFVVAICAALMEMSAVLAAILLPIVAIALFRTTRVVAAASDVESEFAPGLFGTFCQSVILIFSLIVVSICTTVTGAFACCVVLLRHFIQLIPPVYSSLCRCLVRAWQLMVVTWRICDSTFSYLRIDRAFRGTCDIAITLTTKLAGLDRRLLSRF